ncbi:MAG TPA: YetF domain-containing protein [Gemmatimonadales bacterium]|nr:YetF domain-containing protein [Gemmatimonadales bacterium]
MAAFAWVQIDSALGLTREVQDLGALETALRTVLVYAFALAAVRFGSKRFLSQASAFDVIVAIMLGSIMSRAITGSEPMLPTLVSGAVLVALHWLLAALAYRLDWLGPLVKGRPRLLVQDGRADRDEMRKAGVSEQDLKQALRLQARRTDLSGIRLAYLERSGAISFIPAERTPSVVDVDVREGVERVRLEVR